MRQCEPLLHDSDQHICADRDPIVRLHRVLAVAKERLDA